MNRFGFAVITSVLALTAASSNAATRIKVATIVPQASSWGSKIEAARAEIKQRTEGRVELKVYYGGVRGTATQVRRMIRLGDLQGGDFIPSDFQDKMPDLNLYGLPFVFESIEEVNYVREQMDELLAAGFAEHGFVTFGFAGDFAIILSNIPVRRIDDLKGRKIWLPQGDAISDMALKKLHLVPNSKPISDVMIGLKTGLFDVVAMPAAAAIALQLHTVVKYFTDMPVLYAMQFMAIDKRKFEMLNTNDQAVMREVLTRVYSEINEQSPLDAENAKEALANNGVVSVRPDAGEFEKMQKVMAENNRDMARKGMYSLELLETMQRHIDEYRSRNADAAAPRDMEDEIAKHAAVGSK